MSSHNTNAFFVSALLHGLVIGVLLFFTYAMNEQVKEPSKVFELVAGEGDNYMATAAPALGSPNAAKVAMPDLPAPRPVPPEPVQPVSAPVQAAAEPVIERAPMKKPRPEVVERAKTPPDAIRDFSKDVKRIATKREKRLEEKFRKEREAAERRAKEEELRKQRMTKEEFDRQNKLARAGTGANRPPKIAHIDGEGIARGVIGGSTANKIGGAGGKALTREEGDELDLYFSLLKRRLHEALDKPPGLADTLVAVAEFYISADGTLSNVRIKKTSGSADFDQAVLEAFAHVHSIGPRPDGKGETLSLSFRMREEDD